jgi:formate transporter
VTIWSEKCPKTAAFDAEPPLPREPDLSPQFITFEAILPAAMALRAEENGANRAAIDPLNLLVLSILGGAFVSFGAIFATTVGAGSFNFLAEGSAPAAIAGKMPFGLYRLLIGTVFSVGLIMVVIAGAELFTGNNMIVMAWASGRVATAALLTNWTIAFLGNSFGALATAAIMFLTTQYSFGGGAVGFTALNIAESKSALTFVPALTLGIMCNAFVCLAVWMCYAARTTIDRVVTVVPPIAAFAASGFEHCIANVYFIPMGLFIKAWAPDSFWAAIKSSPAEFNNLTWGNFIVSNLIPVTIGNVIGGSVMVAAVYWFVYLRKKPAPQVSNGRDSRRDGMGDSDGE